MEPTPHSVIQAAAELDAALLQTGHPYLKCLPGGSEIGWMSGPF